HHRPPAAAGDGPHRRDDADAPARRARPRGAEHGTGDAPGRARKHRPRARIRLAPWFPMIRTKTHYIRTFRSGSRNAVWLGRTLGLDEGGDPVVQLVDPVEAAVAAGDDRDLGVWDVAGPGSGPGRGGEGGGRAGGK